MLSESSRQSLLSKLFGCLTHLDKYSSDVYSYLIISMCSGFLSSCIVLFFYWPFIIAAHPIGTLLFSYYFSGNELGITLWGERVVRFNGESVHFMGQTEPAVVIFVGATVFVNEGSLRNGLMDGCTSFLLSLCV